MPNAGTAGLRIVAPFRHAVGAAAAVGTTITNAQGVLIKAICPGQTIYLGTSSAVTTANGWPLSDGDVLDIDVRNLNTLWFIATAVDQAIAVLPYGRY